MSEKKKKIIVELQEILNTYKSSRLSFHATFPGSDSCQPCGCCSRERAKRTEEGGEEAGEQKYCWCSNDHEGAMVECSRGHYCNSWVHLKCEGIRMVDVGDGDYVCTRCRAESEVQIVHVCVFLCILRLQLGSDRTRRRRRQGRCSLR